MFKSIQTKTMFFLLAFAISILTIASYLMVFGVESVVRDVEEKNLQEQAHVMADFASGTIKQAQENETVAQGTKLGAKTMQTLFSDETSETAFLLSSSGQTVGCDDEENPYDLAFTGQSDVQDVYKNKTFYIAAVAKIPDCDGWYAVSEITENQAFKSLNNLKTVVISMVMVILFCLWPLGKGISYRIQKPIKELADAAERIAGGDISHGIKTSEEGELANIAAAFNTMLDNLKATMRQVLAKSGEAASMQDIMEYVDETYDNLQAGILSINTIGEITTFNKTAEELTGIKSTELVGINVTNPTPPALKNLMDPLRRCLSRGSLKLKTLTDIKDSDGKNIPVVYNINIQFSMNNEVMGAICVFRSIEDINRFEESATRVKNLESLGEMAASLAHEIKNPLTSIKGYAQYMRKELEGAGINTEEADIITRETDRLSGMLDRFLSFARPKAPKLKRENLGEMMQYVVTLLEKEVPDNIHIHVEVKKTPMVMADREMFEPVLLNLLLNAIQAMPGGGEIRLRTYYDAKRDVVYGEIQDTGSGISPDISDKIFDPFFTTKDDGTGMGLAIASRTVEAHKGVMEVESVEGEMTKFTIMLQAVSDEDESQEDKGYRQ